MADGMLDALAARFVLPAKSGVYVTKNELIVLARLADGSLRVNERRRMLADVLKSPQSPAELSALLDRLIALCQLHLDSWASLVAAYPKAQPFVAPWEAKTRATITSLQDTQAELRLAEQG